MEACLMSEVVHPLPASIRPSSTRHATPRLGGRASLHDIHARENNSFAVEVGEMEQQFLRPNEERHLNVELTSANDNVVQRAREELVTSPHGLLAARMEWSTKPRHSNQPFGNWADNVAAALVRMEPRKISDAPFEGIISRVDAAPIQISLVKATKHTMLRLHSHIVGGTDDLCLINLQLEGLSRTTQRGQEQVSAPGDLAVADTTEPYEITNRRDFKLFCFAVPRPLLPSGFFGRPWLNLSMTDIGRALSRTLAGYAELCLNSPPGVGVPAPIGGQVMDLISHALDLLADAPAERANAPALLSMMLDYIDRHSDDLDLGAATLAAKFNCSPRYVHRLFAGTGRSVGEHINEKRILVCTRNLLDRTGRRRTIAEIAFAAGFGDVSHFNRLFKRSNGATPREFRRAVTSTAT
jgi:AraC family transcriptional regulator, positive regulator of tynA and feaB